MFTKPDPSEYAEFYARYINQLPDTPIMEILRTQPEELKQLLNAVTEEQAEQAYAPGKWSIKELLGHLIDTERIMTYRSLCISRLEEQSLPGFDENQYVQNANFNGRTIAALLNEYFLVRLTTLALFENMDEVMVQRSGKANNNLLTVNALAAIIAAHELHHITIMKERYLKF